MSFMFPPLPTTKFRLIQDIVLDELDDKSFEEYLDIVLSEINNFDSIDHPVQKRLFKNLVAVLSKDELRKSVSKYLSQFVGTKIYEKPENPFIFDGGQFDRGVGIGWAAGTAACQLGFCDWWWEWNKELDDAFFEWIDETFGSEGGGGCEEGDYPIPSSGSAPV